MTSKKFMNLMLATLLGFRGKAPAKGPKVQPDRYPQMDSTNLVRWRAAVDRTDGNYDC